MVVFVQNGFVWAKVVVFGQKSFYSGKSGCIWAKVVVFGQSGCIMRKWLYSEKMVVIGQSGCIRAMWLYSGKSGRNRARWF